MSFIERNATQGKVYAPGYFLAHEECERRTYQMAQAGAVTGANGGKYVPMGTLYSVTSEVDDGEGGTDEVTDYIGIVYEDVDVSSGDMPGSVVTKGTIYENRLPAELTAAAKEALEAKGFVFVTESEVVRPEEV